MDPGMSKMAEIHSTKQPGDYTWFIALGLLYLGIFILLCGPQGILYDALRGLMTGLSLCCVLLYMVLTFLPERFR